MKSKKIKQSHCKILKTTGSKTNSIYFNQCHIKKKLTKDKQNMANTNGTRLFHERLIKL